MPNKSAELENEDAGEVDDMTQHSAALAAGNDCVIQGLSPRAPLAPASVLAL